MECWDDRRTIPSVHSNVVPTSAACAANRDDVIVVVAGSFETSVILLIKAISGINKPRSSSRINRCVKRNNVT